MLKSTNYKGLKEEGRIYGDIPGDVAKRWAHWGIAEAIVEEKKENDENSTDANKGNPDAPIGNTPEPELDFNKMTVKELFNHCREEGIELKKEMINGKTEEEKREYLLLMIKAPVKGE